jgi:hypothetical protein
MGLHNLFILIVAHVVFQQVVFGDYRKHRQEAFGKKVGFGHTMIHFVSFKKGAASEFSHRTYAFSASLRAASPRDTFVLGLEINRVAFHSAFMTPEGLSGRIDVKRAFCVLMKPADPEPTFPPRDLCNGK